MKQRKFLKSFLAVAVMLLALGVLAACGTPTASSTTEATPTNSDIAKIYNQYSAYAEENGITPLAYELWLATI